MDRWRGILKVPLFPNSRTYYRVAVSLCIKSSGKPTVPSANAIFFNGDRVEGTGNPIIEKLSDIQRIAEILVSKLGDSVNAWVFEASTFNGPFAVYKEFIPSVNQWGEPKSYNPTGFPASTSITSLLSTCLKEAKEVILNKREEWIGGGDRTSCSFRPKTLLFGFSKGGTVLNQLVTELAYAEVKSTMNHLPEYEQTMDRENYIENENEIIPTSKESLLDSIVEVHYVDVGLNSAGAYLIDQDIIKRISDRLQQGDSGIRFVLHGTPRQWCDDMRSWIREEKDTMVHLLRSEAQTSGGKLSACERFYFSDRTPNLQMHFEIIESINVT